MVEASKKYGPVTLGLFAVVLTGQVYRHFHRYIANIGVRAWTFAAGTLDIGLFSGGFPVLIYSTLLIGLATSILAMCLAEFASAYPHEAGCAIIATKLGGLTRGRAAVCTHMSPDNRLQR